MDKKPKKALPHLEAACKKDRSVGYLFDLARCQQLAGNPKQSKSLHWEILDQNPFVGASWTNLYVFGESSQKLWLMAQPIIQTGRCTEDEYFLVAVVKLAISLGQTLPKEWFPLAVIRNQVLDTHTGFGNERDELRQAIVAWLSSRPSDADGHNDLPKARWGGLYEKYIWPKRSWIPAT